MRIFVTFGFTSMNYIRLLETYEYDLESKHKKKIWILEWFITLWKLISCMSDGIHLIDFSTWLKSTIFAQLNIIHLLM